MLKLFFLDITDMLEETATESRQATDNESNEEAKWQNGEVIISTDCILSLQFQLVPITQLILSYTVFASSLLKTIALFINKDVILQAIVLCPRDARFFAAVFSSKNCFTQGFIGTALSSV